MWPIVLMYVVVAGHTSAVWSSSSTSMSRVFTIYVCYPSSERYDYTYLCTVTATLLDSDLSCLEALYTFYYAGGPA